MKRQIITALLFVLPLIGHGQTNTLRTNEVAFLKAFFGLEAAKRALEKKIQEKNQARAQANQDYLNVLVAIDTNFNPQISSLESNVALKQAIFNLLKESN